MLIEARKPSMPCGLNEVQWGIVGTLAKPRGLTGDFVSKLQLIVAMWNIYLKRARNVNFYVTSPNFQMLTPRLL